MPAKIRSYLPFGILLVVMILATAFEFRGVEQWWKGRVDLEGTDCQLVKLRAGSEAIPLTFSRTKILSFGERRTVINVSSDEYRLHLQPGDHRAARHLELRDNQLHGTESGWYHVILELELLPTSGRTFDATSTPRTRQLQRIVSIDRTVQADWQTIPLGDQSAVIQRLATLFREMITRYETADTTRFQSGDVVLLDEQPYYCTQLITTLRGGRSRSGSCGVYTGNGHQDLPMPPAVLGSPRLCNHKRQLVVAGGEPLDPQNSGPPHPVFAWSPQNEKWFELPELPVAIQFFDAIVSFEGQLCVLAADGYKFQRYALDEPSQQWRSVHTYSDEIRFEVGDIFTTATHVFNVAMQDGGPRMLKALNIASGECHVVTVLPEQQDTNVFAHDGDIYAVSPVAVYRLNAKLP